MVSHGFAASFIFWLLKMQIRADQFAKGVMPRVLASLQSIR